MCGAGGARTDCGGHRGSRPGDGSARVRNWRTSPAPPHSPEPRHPAQVAQLCLNVSILSFLAQ